MEPFNPHMGYGFQLPPRLRRKVRERGGGTYDEESESEEETSKPTKKIAFNREAPELVGIIGPTKRGKSHYMIWQCKKGFAEKKWEYAMVFCPTARAQGAEGDWEDFPKEFIWTNPNLYEAALENLLELQVYNGCPPCAVFIDDALGGFPWKAPVVQRLMTTYRQYNIYVMFTTQNSTSVPNMYWVQCNRGIVFRLTNRRDIENVWDKWVQSCDTPFRSWKDLDAYMKKNMPVEERKFLEIDRNPNCQIELKISKAPPKEKFQHIKVKFNTKKKKKNDR